MMSAQRTLLAVSLALAGCAERPTPLPVTPAPAPRRAVDPCESLSRQARHPPVLRLDGSAETRLVASCATRDSHDTFRVIVSSPDLSVLRPTGFSHLQLELDVADPAAALATLPPVRDLSTVTLVCKKGTDIPASAALRAFPRTNAIAGTCLSFSLRQESVLSESTWHIELHPDIPRHDFDALVDFARSHPPRLTLGAKTTAWAGAFADLPVRPNNATVRCDPNDAAVDLAALAKLRPLRTLALDGPCRLEKGGEIDTPAPFQELSSVLWTAPGHTADLRGIRAFGAAQLVSIHAQKILGGPEIAALQRVRHLRLHGPLDAEPAGKELRWLAELSVSDPIPAFVADLPSLNRLATGTCGPVRSSTVRSMECTPAPATSTALADGSARKSAPALDLRGTPGLETLHLHGPCLPITSKSLEQLSCTLDGPVSFRGAPGLTRLTVTLGPDVNSLSPLAEIQKLESLSITAHSSRRVSLEPLGRATGLTTLRLDAGCFAGLADLYALPRLAQVLAPRPPPAPPGSSRIDVRESGQDMCPRANVAQ